MNPEIDLIQRRAFGWAYELLAALQRWGLPKSAVDWASPVIPLAGVALLVGVLAALVSWLDRAWSERPRHGARWWMLAGAHALAALVALRLLYWLYLHPSRELQGIVSRWDYLVMVAAGGLVLRRAGLRVRIWILALLSIVLVDQYVGRLPVSIVVSACLLGYLATRWEPTSRPGVRVVVQGVVLGAALAILWWLRASDPWSALLGWGLYSFAAFRHVSFVVEQARGTPATFGGYLCYLLFFPNCAGAMEVYDEFHERNLRGDAPAAFGSAALMVARGNSLVWLGLMIPVDDVRVMASEGFASMWSALMALFFRAALISAGFWDVIEGGALFLGIRLRPNFRYVLAATTPSQFWRAWRATMTNWLIRYVYIPLGGNRRHQAFNVLAAFVVSTVWHCLGIPFLRPATWQPYELAPVLLWGALNFAAIATHARVRRVRPPASPNGPSGALVLAGKWALAMVFGSLTVLLLGFSLGGIERFGHALRTLLGLEGW